MDTSFASRERDRLLSELTEFLAIPSISALPNHTGDCRRAAEWLAAELARLGCPTVEVIDGEGQPIVWAESPKVPGRPTLLIYGHYDVQPPDPLEEWVTPPFEPTVRDGQIFARGAVDDKGQVYCLLKAYEATLGTDRQPPCNVHFIFEGEEESGGHHIYDLLTRRPELTRADAALVADMSFFAPGWPAVYTGLRGMCYAEIHVRTLQRDLHSGSYGGVAPNALETLVRILGELKGSSGKIRIPKLYGAVEPPTREELKTWQRLPFDEEEFRTGEVTAKAITGRRKFSIFERIWALPTFEIHGIMGGFTGAGAKTVIPARAAAKVSLRLVPNQKVEKVLKQLERAVREAAPDWADVEVRFLHGNDPVRVDVSHPAFDVLDEAFESVVGRRTVQVRAGGSIPIIPQLGASGAPVILTGIGLPDDGLHSPNEKLDLEQLWTGISVFGHFLELFAERVGAGGEPDAVDEPHDGDEPAPASSATEESE